MPAFVRSFASFRLFERVYGLRMSSAATISRSILSIPLAPAAVPRFSAKTSRLRMSTEKKRQRLQANETRPSLIDLLNKVELPIIDWMPSYFRKLHLTQHFEPIWHGCHQSGQSIRRSGGGGTDLFKEWFDFVDGLDGDRHLNAHKPLGSGEKSQAVKSFYSRSKTRNVRLIRSVR